MRMKREPSFEEALEQCLEALRRGAGDPEALAARYPAYADRLRPLLETASRLRTVDLPPPRPEAVRRGRARVVAAARHRGVPATSRAMGGRRGWVSALLTVGLLLALLFGGGALGVRAAEASLPGDPLYGVKLLAESAELAWAERWGDPTPVLMRQIERRSLELEALQRQGRGAHPAALDRSALLLIRLARLAERHPEHPLLRERALAAVARHRAILEALAEQAPPAARPALQRALERAHRAQEILSKLPRRSPPGPSPERPRPLRPGR